MTTMIKAITIIIVGTDVPMDSLYRFTANNFDPMNERTKDFVLFFIYVHIYFVYITFNHSNSLGTDAYHF